MPHDLHLYCAIVRPRCTAWQTPAVPNLNLNFRMRELGMHRCGSIDQARAGRLTPDPARTGVPGLLWVALVVWLCWAGLGAYGGFRSVDARAAPWAAASSCPPPHSLHTLCPATPVERDYVAGKASECLLGPVVRTRTPAPSFGAQLGWGEDAELLRVKSEVQQAVHLASDSGASAGVISPAACHTLCNALAREIGATRSATRFLKVVACGRHALQRLSAPRVSSPADDALLAAVVRQVSSELALQTPFHVDIICGVIDTPLLWEHALGAVQAEDAGERGDKDGECAGKGSTGDAAASCGLASWQMCSNATDVERALFARMQTQTAASAINNALQHAARLLHERTNDAGAAELVSLVLDVPLDTSSPHISTVTAHLRAGKSLQEIAVSVLQKGPDDPGVLACKAGGGCGARAREAVEQVFREVLLRPADESALRTYTWRVQSDGDVWRLRHMIMNSEEFEATCRNGRDSGPDRPSCAVAQVRAEALYAHVLARPADSAGRMHYARLLALGERDVDQLRLELEQSEEFRTVPSSSICSVLCNCRALHTRVFVLGFDFCGFLYTDFAGFTGFRYLLCPL